MVRVDGYFVCQLKLIDVLEDSEPLTDSGDPDILKTLCIEQAQNITRYSVF